MCVCVCVYFYDVYLASLSSSSIFQTSLTSSSAFDYLAKNKLLSIYLSKQQQQQQKKKKLLKSNQMEKQNHNTRLEEWKQNKKARGVLFS